MLKSGRSFLCSFVVAAVLCVFGAEARARAACPPTYLVSGAIKGYTATYGGGICNAAITLDFAADMVYREYSFDSTGLFMIFISVDGPEDTSTGARNFFLFPRGSAVGLEKLENGDLQIRSAGGNALRVSKDTARIAGFSGARISEDEKINMTNEGGVEILSFDGLLLDTGWKTGGLSYANSKRDSVFRDSAGHTCKVRNSEIFDYSTSGPELKFATDADLARFLAARCPELSQAWMTAPMRSFIRS